MGENPRIGIIGGGVNGIGVAIALLESFHDIQLTVYSDYFSPYTTGDGSAGLWSPYIVPGTPIQHLIKWSKATWDLLETWKKEEKFGVFSVNVRKISKEELLPPPWSSIANSLREFTQEELKQFGPEYINGHTYKAYVAEPGRFLPHLMKTVKLLGGRLERRNVRRIEDLGSGADIIINCSGIGARDIVPDHKVYPVRGQMMRVKIPSFKRVTFDYSSDTFAYMIPNNDCVVLGGTHQENDWRTTIDLEDSKRIWNNCARLEPSLKNAEILEEWAGLRPLRKGGIRLEQDYVQFLSKQIPVVHNYGHGGSGVTTFWGCSTEVRDLVGQIIHRKFRPISSKL